MCWVSLWLSQEREEKGPGLAAAPSGGPARPRPHRAGSPSLPVPQFQPGCRQEPGVLRAPENSWTEGRATRNLALMGPELGSLRTKLDVPSMSRGPSASPLLPEHAMPQACSPSPSPALNPSSVQPSHSSRGPQSPDDSADHPIPSFPQGDLMGVLMRLAKGPMATLSSTVRQEPRAG